MNIKISNVILFCLSFLLFMTAYSEDFFEPEDHLKINKNVFFQDYDTYLIKFKSDLIAEKFYSQNVQIERRNFIFRIPKSPIVIFKNVNRLDLDLHDFFGNTQQGRLPFSLTYKPDDIDVVEKNSFVSELLNDRKEWSQNLNQDFFSRNFSLKDPLFLKQWGLFSISKFGIQIQNLWTNWNLEQLSSVVVGVIDSGLILSHPDLINQLWINKAEQLGLSGVDDDNNGYIDDIYGYDFYHDTPHIDDDTGHGTHCAGVIAAQTNNSIGISGIHPNAQIMALRFLDSIGNGTTEGALRAIYYAADKGVRLINNSWGSYNYSNILKKVLSDNQDMLFVSASGNDFPDANDNDKNPMYPASYKLPNVISVTGINRQGTKLFSSNFGAKSVHLGAPGERILSTDLEHGYAYRTGTSMATPFVTGVAALLLSKDPRISISKLKQLLLNSVFPLDDLDDKTQTGGSIFIPN